MTARAIPAGEPDRQRRRMVEARRRAEAREARWQAKRLAVPYRVDGPKVSLGILWFVLLLGAALWGVSAQSGTIAALAVMVVATPVAAMAGLQVGNAWFPKLAATRMWTSMAAVLAAVPGIIGPLGVVVGVVLGLVVLVVYIMLYRGHRRTPLQLLDVLARSSLPLGLAVASMAALARVELGALISLILLVSAYETGDFLVGTGSSNAVEGPLAGLVALGTATFFLFLALPAPFTATSVLLFAALAGVCCPLGQIAASGMLPRGGLWAPALRRLDSYLLVSPIWLILLNQLPQLN